MITAVELENQPKNNHGDRQTFLAPEVVKDRQPARGNSAKVPVCINPRRDPMFDYKTNQKYLKFLWNTDRTDLTD
jgi:hypothetical protein